MAGWPQNISKLSFGGSLPRGDIWSMNLYLDDGGEDIGSNRGEYQGVITGIAEAVIAWFRSPSSLISQSARLSYLKLNQIGPDGKYKNPYTNVVNIPIPDGSGSQPSSLAGGVNVDYWQHFSLCLTHRAAETRGPATQGRTYPPAVIVSPNAQGAVPAAQLQPYVNNYTNMLSNIYTAVPGELRGMPLIVSTGTKLAPNQGTRRPIVRVSVGDVPDVQQRRRNASPENYLASTAELNYVGEGVVPGGPGPNLP